MFEELQRLNSRPKPFEFYTAEALWNDEHISKQMLAYHLNEDVDLASRNRAFVDESAGWIIEHFKLGPGRRVCDLGCGPGLYTTKFAEAGAEVTGVDFSETSIGYARDSAAQKKLNTEYIRQNYLEFESEKKFDLITLIFCDFCPLSPEQRAKLLAIVRRHLAEGGAFLLDVITLEHFAETKEVRSYEYEPEGGFWSPKAYYMFLDTFKYEPEKVILNKHTLIEKDRRREIFNWLACFSLESLSSEFESAGFRIVETFGDVAGKPFDPRASQMTVVARVEA